MAVRITSQRLAGVRTAARVGPEKLVRPFFHNRTVRNRNPIPRVPGLEGLGAFGDAVSDICAKAKLSSLNLGIVDGCDLFREILRAKGVNLDQLIIELEQKGIARVCNEVAGKIDIPGAGAVCKAVLERVVRAVEDKVGIEPDRDTAPPITNRTGLNVVTGAGSRFADKRPQWRCVQGKAVCFRGLTSERIASSLCPGSPPSCSKLVPIAIGIGVATAIGLVLA